MILLCKILSEFTHHIYSPNMKYSQIYSLNYFSKLITKFTQWIQLKLLHEILSKLFFKLLTKFTHWIYSEKYLANWTRDFTLQITEQNLLCKILTKFTQEISSYFKSIDCICYLESIYCMDPLHYLSKFTVLCQVGFVCWVGDLFAIRTLSLPPLK